MSARNRIVAVVVASLAASACRVGRDYEAPALDAPASWSEPRNGTAPADAWWTSFGDPELTRVVERALGANRDARVAVARLREARAARGVVEAALGPEIDLSGSYSHTRISSNGFLKSFSAGAGELPGGVVPGQEIDLWQVGLDASWEIDLFGRNRRAIEAARADLASADLDLDAVLLALAADVSSAYVDLRALERRLAIARSDVALLEDTLSVVRELSGAGLASDLDLARAESQVATAAARVPDLDAAVVVARNRLALLAGEPPGALDAELAANGALPTPPTAFATGVPADVLRRRPDVRAAERRYAAEFARIGVATGDLYPRIDLIGSFGLQSQKLSELPESDSRFFSIGPSIRWPLLDWGRARARIAVQDARAEAARARFESTVLGALSEVEDALVRLARAGRSRDELVRSRDAARRAVDVAQSLYQSGVIEFLELLDAERTLADAEDAAVRADAAVAQDTVALLRALGGGFESARAVTSAAAERQRR